MRLSEILAALSHALDITEGQPRGHAERTCLIAMRIAEQLGLDDATRSSLFYAALLKDAGCSSNAAKVAALYGADDADVKRDRKVTDHLRPPSRCATSRAAPARAARRWPRRATCACSSPTARPASRALTELRCERGADVARSVGLDEVAADRDPPPRRALGRPRLPARACAARRSRCCGRMLCLAQTAEVFWQDGGAARRLRVARERRGTWFDPALVDALCAVERRRRASGPRCETPRSPALEPADRVLLADDDRLDRVAEAFARDRRRQVALHRPPLRPAWPRSRSRSAARSASTPSELRDAAPRRAAARHRQARRLQPDPRQARQARRPRVGGDAPPPAWTLRDPAARPGASRGLAEVAAAHHERLDGSGYFRGLTAGQLDLPVAHPGGRRRRRGAQRRAALPRGAGPRRGAGDHAPRRRPRRSTRPSSACSRACCRSGRRAPPDALAA